MHLDFDAPALVSFARKGPNGEVPGPEADIIELIGFEYERLPGSELHWMNWGFRARTDAHGDYILLPEGTLPGGKALAFEKQRPAYGLEHVYGWDAGKVITHGELLRGPDNSKLRGPLPVAFRARLLETHPDGSLLDTLLPFGHEGSHLVRSGEEVGVFSLGAYSSEARSVLLRS